jgi:hypothetical protein
MGTEIFNLHHEICGLNVVFGVDATTESNINFVLPSQQRCALMDCDITRPGLGYAEN